MDLMHPCDVENHSEKVLIQYYRNLMDEMDASVIHILREGNRCVDILPKMGINQGEQDIKIKADLMGASGGIKPPWPDNGLIFPAFPFEWSLDQEPDYAEFLKMVFLGGVCD
ncbi:hypothetical protein LguiA_017380 [Lonicera macranthoides]